MALACRRKPPIGLDPERMSLACGGPGGVHEMREAIGNHPHTFGLLRMAFGLGDEARTVFLFIHVWDIQIKGVNCWWRRQDIPRTVRMVPEMKKKVSQYASCSAHVRIQFEEECAVEVLVERLRTVEGLACPLITWPNYYCHNSPVKKMIHAGKKRQAQAQLGNDETWHSSSSCNSKASSTTMALSETVATPTSQYLETPMQCQLPSSKVASPSPKEDCDGEFMDAVQRQIAKAYRVGDLVEVRSINHDTWIMDAEIVDRVTEKCEKDGKTRRAGSVKVLYNDGERFRWVPPQ